MSEHRFTDPEFGAWLGYRDSRLVGIDLPWAHGGESFKSWAAEFDRAEIVDEDEALRRWATEVRGVIVPCAEVALGDSEGSR